MDPREVAAKAAKQAALKGDIATRKKAAKASRASCRLRTRRVARRIRGGGRRSRSRASRARKGGGALHKGLQAEIEGDEGASAWDITGGFGVYSRRI